MLDFKPFNIESKNILEPYYFQYGEGSCQHSFTSSFCMKEKYGDCYDIKDDFLFVFRSKRSAAGKRVYLFPLGDIKDPSAACRAVDRVIEDAHERGAKVVFETVTKNACDFLYRYYEKTFYIEEKRENAEYIFSREKLTELGGKDFEEKRWEIHKFQKEYEGRFKIERMNDSHFIQIKDFTEKWYRIYSSPENQNQLSAEKSALNFALDNFDQLGLDGIVILIDNKIAAYALGMKLNRTYYDGFMEKADRTYKYIYKTLNHSVAKYCSSKIKWLNWEEDLGNEGLRKMKLSWKPEFLIKKFLATEKD